MALGQTVLARADPPCPTSPLVPAAAHVLVPAVSLTVGAQVSDSPNEDNSHVLH